jgi:hypothetical protein
VEFAMLPLRVNPANPTSDKIVWILQTCAVGVASCAFFAPPRVFRVSFNFRLRLGDRVQ